MNRIIFVLLIFFISISAWPKTSHHLKHYPPSPPLAYFSSIDVGDDIHLQVLHGRSSPHLNVNWKSPEMQEVLSMEVKDRTLILRRPEVPGLEPGQASFPPLNLKVWTNNVCEINTYGTARVGIRGNFNIQKIVTHGASEVDARWLRACHLIVRSFDNSKTTLAGNVDIFDAGIFQSSFLDAQFLRAHEAYIATEECACAHVLPVRALNAFAKGFSNIYYYKTPTYLTSNGYESGNVIQAGYSN